MDQTTAARIAELEAEVNRIIKKHAADTRALWAELHLAWREIDAMQTKAWKGREE